MAIYRLYPEADTFITTFKSESNAGLDEIVEIGGFPNKTILGETSRIIVKFKNTEIQSTLNNIVDNSFSANSTFLSANSFSS